MTGRVMVEYFIKSDYYSVMNTILDLLWEAYIKGFCRALTEANSFQKTPGKHSIIEILRKNCKKTFPDRRSPNSSCLDLRKHSAQQGSDFLHILPCSLE